MRMTGFGSFVRPEIGRQEVNGGGSIYVRQGYTPPASTTTVAPISYPTGQSVTPQGDVISIPATPEQRGGITLAPPPPVLLPGPSYGNDVVLIRATPGQRGGITQAPGTLRPGAAAKPGEASAATSVYGAGGSYYGAPEGGNGAAEKAAPKPAGFLPIGLLLLALLGT